MKNRKRLLLGCSILLISIISSCASHNSENDSKTGDMLIRIAEIKIDSIYHDEYIIILKEESEASIRLEPGVLSIFPMFQKDDPTEIRLLEIYASKEAYEYHLQTPHFKEYKTATLHMVKSLKLVEMDAIDPERMSAIFRKVSNGNKD
jgi:quinol monooxygenase YgiN